ncbi:Holliday junction resolvase RuvX [Patescibacteria group bacterium]|nr:Holliday junction resolvase RuvX [Patescibacteria group bacterium]MBU1868730.1 Holliday junction resolvase RuvX [Patescibacteria group bacterium]
MSLLAIDYGEKHLGLAISRNNSPAQILRSIIHQSEAQILGELQEICDQYSIKEIILGLPLRGGKLERQAKEVQRFGNFLAANLSIKVNYIDESLTSKQSTAGMLEACVPKQKRKHMEHSFAAKLILDDWLDC